jgi:hypothetical protein
MKLLCGTFHKPPDGNDSRSLPWSTNIAALWRVHRNCYHAAQLGKQREADRATQRGGTATWRIFCNRHALIVIDAYAAFALGLSVPPKRQSSAFGIGIGVIILVCFIQAAHAIEATASNSSLLQFILLWGVLAAITGFVWRCYVVRGPGFVEDKLHRLVLLIINGLGWLEKLF